MVSWDLEGIMTDLRAYLPMKTEERTLGLNQWRLVKVTPKQSEDGQTLGSSDLNMASLSHRLWKCEHKHSVKYFDIK